VDERLMSDAQTENTNSRTDDITALNEEKGKNTPDDFVVKWRGEFEITKFFPEEGSEKTLLIALASIVLGMVVVVWIISLLGAIKKEGFDPKALFASVLGVSWMCLVGWWVWRFAKWWNGNRSLIKRLCPRCGKYVGSDLQWRCGRCGHENRNTREFSFLDKCEECKQPPKAYRCHWCGQSIFLDRDKDDKHCATVWTPAPAVKEPEDAIGIKWQRDKEQLQQALELSRLATALAKQKTEQRLAEAAGDPERWKSKSARELQEEEFARVRDAQLARFEIIARAKSEATAEPDKSLSERKLEVIAWMKNEWGIE
jgi:hypothetical protein